MYYPPDVCCKKRLDAYKMLTISNAMMFQFYAYQIFLEAIRLKNSVLITDK